MSTITAIIARVRLEIGDPVQPFRTTALGDNTIMWFDLPKQQIQALSEVAIVNGASYTTLSDASAARPWSASTAYAVGTYATFDGYFYQCLVTNTNVKPHTDGTSSTDWAGVTSTVYTINDEMGQMQFGAPIPLNATLVVTGTCWSLFSDTELADYVGDAVNQHCFNRQITERFMDARGFHTYRDTPLGLSNLPAIEEPLVVMLSTINTFWTLANDTASDFNVQTAEGTSINRTAQYQQIMQQIQALTARYQDLCGQLNVGVYRMETLSLRRSSRTTGRLVPLFKPREYDDHRWPTRELPPIDHRYDDSSGIPSPLWQGNGGY